MAGIAQYQQAYYYQFNVLHTWYQDRQHMQKQTIFPVIVSKLKNIPATNESKAK